MTNQTAVMTPNKNQITPNSTFSGSFSVVTADITPPLSIYARNWGASAHDRAEAVHRPLWMQCFLMQSITDDLLVWFTADLGWWKNNSDELSLRNYILTKTDLKEEQVLFCLSHTHAGPSICSADKDKPGGDRIAPYLKFLAETAVSLYEEGRRKMQKGTLTWGYGSCNLATKRDFFVDGTYLIGYDPTQKADDTLLVGAVRDEKGKRLAILVNYACHPTTFAHENKMLSPDYIGSLREVVETYSGCPCLFFQGASGDLAPKEQYVADPAIVDGHGRRLGHATIATLESIPQNNMGLEFKEALISGAPLALWKPEAKAPNHQMGAQIIHVEMDYKELPSEDELLEAYEKCEDRVLKDRLWRKINTRRAIGGKKTEKVPVWIWQLGNAVVIAQANETYSVIQEQLRSAFPDNNIVFINIANGYVGYLPPSDLYDKDMYAVWQTPYAKGSLEKMIDRITEAIQTLNL